MWQKLKVLRGAALLFVLSACSHQGFFWASPSHRYQKFLRERVEEAQIYDRARLLLRVRSMLVEKDLIEAQNVVIPGHTIEWRKDSVQVLLAVQMSGRELFAAEDFKITLNGVPSAHIREITNQTEVEQLYPFAFPYLRLFVVEFNALDSKLVEQNKLKVLSPVGAMELTLKARFVGR